MWPAGPPLTYRVRRSRYASLACHLRLKEGCGGQWRDIVLGFIVLCSPFLGQQQPPDRRGDGFRFPWLQAHRIESDDAPIAQQRVCLDRRRSILQSDDEIEGR